MNSLRRELEDEEERLRNIRVRRWHKPTKKGRSVHSIPFVTNKELQDWDDINLDEVDEYTSTAVIDKNFDSIAEGEIDNIVASLKSGLDVSVCDNVFTIPANAPLHDIEITAGSRRAKYERKLANVVSVQQAKGIETWQKMKPFIMMRKRLNRDKQYAFRQFPDKDKRRATGMKYALIMSNAPIGKEGNTVLYFHTLKEARAKMREYINDFGYEPKHLEVMKAVGE